MQSVMLTLARQAEGRAAASVALILSPALDSSLSLITTQRHFLLLPNTCLSPPQQSTVGVLASPSTNDKHGANPIKWFLHSALSWFTSELAKPNSTVISNMHGSIEDAIVFHLRRKERKEMKMKMKMKRLLERLLMKEFYYGRTRNGGELFLIRLFGLKNVGLKNE